MPLSIILLAVAVGALTIGVSGGLVALIFEDWRHGDKVDALHRTGFLLFLLTAITAIILAAMGL